MIHTKDQTNWEKDFRYSFVVRKCCAWKESVHLDTVNVFDALAAQMEHRQHVNLDGR
jgi:hypothetical protein